MPRSPPAARWDRRRAGPRERPAGTGLRPVAWPGRRRQRDLTVRLGSTRSRDRAQTRQSQWNGCGGAVLPQPGVRVEGVVGQEPMAVPGNQPHCVDEVVADSIGDEVVEVEPHPARLDPVAAEGNLVVVAVGVRGVDGEQPVSVRSGAGAAAAGLDAEQVVEQGDHEVVVQEQFSRRGCGVTRWTAVPRRGCRGSLCRVRPPIR